MKHTQHEKEKLRRQIAATKKNYTQEELTAASDEVLAVLEIIGVFEKAKTVFIYNNLQDEVQTILFIEKWKGEKDFYLPAIVNNALVFRKYESASLLTPSSFGIQEPTGADFNNFKQVDLIIVPGLAFDRHKNRLGRGKGFYDRFLSPLVIPKVGICFDFQLLDAIPSNANDIKMDYIVSENELIW